MLSSQRLLQNIYLEEWFWDSGRVSCLRRKRTRSRRAIGESKAAGAYANDSGANCGTGRSVPPQGTAVLPPVRNRTSTHAVRSRQKTRLTRPDWPQYGPSSEVIVTAHPQSAIYGAVCRWLKRDHVRSRTAHHSRATGRRYS